MSRSPQNIPFHIKNDTIHLLSLHQHTPQIQEDKKKSTTSVFTHNKSSLCEDEYKSINIFKEEWIIQKQIGWGGEGSVFEIKPTNIDPMFSIQYVAKIMYFTNEDIYKSIQDKINA
eukprot:739894_1